MSYAANPNKPNKAESAEVVATKQQKADRERIRRLVITLGDDSSKKVSGQIRGLAGALEDDVELHGDLLLETAVECIQNLPLKTGIMAAWVTRMAAKHERWSGRVVEQCLEDLRNALRSGGQTTVAQLCIRFFVCLGNTGLLGMTGVLTLLEEVMALSSGVKASKGGDLGFFLTLSSLPFISATAFKMVSERVDSILASWDTYAATRDARWLKVLRTLSSDQLPDRLEALANSLRTMRQQAEWSSQAILHVPGFEPSLEGRATCSSKLTSLGISAEAATKGKAKLLVPASPLRLLSTDAGSADNQMAEADRWVLEDYIILTMEKFRQDVEECSKQILRIPVLHTQFEAVAVETVFSQLLRLPHPPLLPLFYSRLLENMVLKQSSVKQVIDRAFSALIQRLSDLDEDCFDVLSEAFAYNVVINAFEADWDAFIGGAVPVERQRFARRALERLQRLSFHQNLLHRLPEAVHAYVPPEPLPATELAVQAKPEFAKMLGIARIKDPDEQKVLKYCSRLMKLDSKPSSGQDKDEMDMALPVQPTTLEPREGPTADREAEGLPASKKRRLDEAGNAMEAAAGGATEEDAETDADKGAARDVEKDKLPDDGTSRPTVKEESVEKDGAPVKAKEEAGSGDGDAFGEAPIEPWQIEAVIELLTAAVMQNGAKTPTHMSKILDGHEKVFRKLRPGDEEDAHSCLKAMVRCIFAFWRQSGQRLEITLDSLLHRGVVSPRAVVEQALEECKQVGDSLAVWNMVNSVAKKSLERTRAIQEELAIGKQYDKTEVIERCRTQLEGAVHETAELFTQIFTGLVRNFQDLEGKDQVLRQVTLQRVLAIGRKYHVFIKPLIKAAESRIPGVALNPEIAAVFQALRTL